jgi:5-methylcytosine-specific restriction endonuclease McrA
MRHRILGRFFRIAGDRASIAASRLRVASGCWQASVVSVSQPKERQHSRAERLICALKRDGAICVWCSRRLPIGSCDASVDHLVPKLKGGPSWSENEVAACRRCNRARGHISPMDWLRRCQEQGFQPAVALIAQRLQSLASAIEERGGQRKARPYLAGQLRRLEKWHKTLFQKTS